jgi:hypothetical protein
MTERVRVTSIGNVGVGSNSPGVRLVNSGATLATSPTLGSGTIGADAILSANGLYGLYTGVSSAGHVWMQVQRNDATTPVYPLSLQPVGGGVLIETTTSNGNTLRVNGTGFFDSSVTATSFFESSDSRIKTLIEDDLDYRAIAGVTTKYYEKNSKKELGYFAQDFETLLPSAVSKNQDGYLNLSYREVHTAKIAALEKRITELESQLKNN